MVYVPPGVNTVVEIVTTCVAPGAIAGVIVKESGDADRPVTAGDGRLTVQVTEAAVPLVRVATTLGEVLAPAATVALVGFQATV
jgi:citrate lyase alpha subunit